MTPEDFVTYDQAVKLKKLGFNWDCNHYYDTETNTFVENAHYDVAGYFDPDASSYYNHNCCHNSVSAPTLAQVLKWLRNTKELLIQVGYRFHKKWNGTISNLRNGRIYTAIDDNNTYEEAISEGIDKALELLKENKV